MDSMFIAAAALACPIGMGAMMWFMAKGMRGDRNEQPAAPEESADIDDLREEHARLAAEIDRLEGASRADPLAARR